MFTEDKKGRTNTQTSNSTIILDYADKTARHSQSLIKAYISFVV